MPSKQLADLPCRSLWLARDTQFEVQLCWAVPRRTVSCERERVSLAKLRVEWMIPFTNAMELS